MIRSPFEAPAARPTAPLAGTRRAPAHLLLEEFLVLEELVGLMRFTLEREAEFTQTTVRHGKRGTTVVDAGYRRSRAISRLAQYHELFSTRLLEFLPFIFERLGHAPFEPTTVEAQITASNDGDFYRPHADNAHGRLRSRTITFVYYFYQPPKAFTGGELRLRDEAGRETLVGPEQNQMVLFASGLVHEILPVSCPSRRFADSRFALNGWLHR